MESSVRIQTGQYQAYAGQPSNHPDIREGHQDGASGQLRSSTTISNQHVLFVPVLLQTQGGQCLPYSGQYWSGQPPNQQASSRHSPLTSLLLNNTDSKTTTCVEAQNRNHPQPGKSNFENVSLLENYKGQSKDSQVSSQNSPTAINAQQGRHEGASHGIPDALAVGRSTTQVIIPQAVLIQQHSNGTSSPVTPAASCTSFPSNQGTCLPLNQRNGDGSEMSRTQHGVSLHSHPPIPPTQKSQSVNINNAVSSQLAKLRSQYPAGLDLQQQQKRLGNGLQRMDRGSNQVLYSCVGLYNTNSQNASISPTGASLSVVNHKIQSPPPYPPPPYPAPPSHPVRQSFYQTVTKDQSGNGFRAGNVVFMGSQPNENILVLQGQQQQGPSLSNGSQLAQINMSHQLAHQVPQNNIRVQQPAAPVSSPQRRQKAIAVVQPLSQAQQIITTDTLTARKPVESLLKNTIAPTLDSTLTPTQGKDNADTASGTIVNEDPVNQASNKRKRKAPVTLSEGTELCSVPVVSWTLNTLTELLKWCRHKGFTQNENGAVTDVTGTILSRYWDGNYQEMVDMMASDYYNNLVGEAADICRKHESQTVIFSHVRREHLGHLKEKCHVLGHDAVYPQTVHKSSWLNTNEQLDDIDKEHGFPQCLKNYQQEQPELIGTEDEAATEMPQPHALANEMPQPHASANEMPQPHASANEMPQPHASANEMPQPNTSTLGSEPNVESEIQGSCTQRETPVQMQCAEDDCSSDPFYSMEIHVLAPEEAKNLHLFEDVRVRDEDNADQQRGAMLGPVVDELPEEMDVDLTEVKSDNKVEGLMEEYCCFSMLMAKLHGMNSTIPCPCQCKSKLTPGRPTFNGSSLVEENSVEINYLAMPKVQFSPVKSDVNPATSTETEQQCIVIDPDENNETYSSADSKSCPLSRAPVVDLTIDSSASDGEVESDVSCRYAHSDDTLMTEPKWYSEPSKQKVPAPPQMNASLDTTDMEPGESEAAFRVNSCDAQFSSMEKVSYLASLALIQRHDHSLTSERDGRVLKKQPAVQANLSVNCNELFGEHNTSDEDIELVKLKAIEEERLEASSTLTGHGTDGVVQLALFGSSPQRKHGTVPTRQSMRVNPFTGRALMPPQTLNVSVSSGMREGASVTSRVMKSPKVKTTVKERLLKDWKDRFVPTTTAKPRRGPGRPPKRRKMYVVDTTSTKIDGSLPALPEGSSPAGSEQTRSRKESIINGLKLRLKKISPHKTIEKSEIGKPVFRVSQENSVLRFSVLPKSFNFREQEHTDTETATGSKTDMGDAVSWKSSRTVQKPKVAWSTDTEKKYSPFPSTKPKDPKSTNAFQEYQKKYMEKK